MKRNKIRDSLLKEAARKLKLIQIELDTYNCRSKKGQRTSAWITIELIEKIMEGKY